MWYGSENYVPNQKKIKQNPNFKDQVSVIVKRSDEIIKYEQSYISRIKFLSFQLQGQ